jgi:pimeloyl-ACP methyl ester carboxylesterase
MTRWWIGILWLAVGLAPAQVVSTAGQENEKGSQERQPAASSSLQLQLQTLDRPAEKQSLVVEPSPVPVSTELGEINGASFRIDIPQQGWNKGLVMYFHGYEQKPRVFALGADSKPYPPSRVLQQLLNRGYAVAESGYSTGGWAVSAAAQDQETLRRYFVKKYGAPKEIFAMGHSMGGLLTVMALEQHPDAYSGGLALCGVLAPAHWVMQRAFANRVAFDALFPGILPDVEHIPDSFSINDLPTISTIEKALNSAPAQASVLRDLSDIHTTRGLADVLVFNTFVIKDLRQKANGNPFDNRNMIYTGTTDDNTLNDKVKRYAADERAVAYLAQFYTPTGDLKKKLLAVHTVYDPLVPAATSTYYDMVTQRRGVGNLFVQQYVKRDGHCNFTADQTGQAFDELTLWVHGGKRPDAGLLPGSAPPSEVVQPVSPRKPKEVGKPQ